MNGHQVKLLHSERIARTINGAWSLSSESGSPGVMVITNLRLVWFADLTPDLNVSLPWLCVKSAPSARSSKFGDVLVILSADYRLGFRLDEFPTLAALEPLVEDLKHRRGSMIASPFFATDLYLETLPPLENPLEYNRKAEEVMYQASDASATLAPVDVEDKPTVPVEALPSEQSPSADPTAPPGLEMSEKDLQEAFKRGRKAWGRSKIMIVGEGRAGKTALANSVMGKPFEETSSTVGINLFTCDIKYAAVGNGQWDKHESPDRLLEAALAQMIADEKFKRKHRVVKDFEFAEDVLNSSVTMVWAAEERELTEFSASVDISALRVEQVADSAVSTMDTEPPTATVIKKSMLSTASAEAVVMAAAVYPAPSTSKQNACAAEPDATIDNELVMKCLANGIQTESKFIISLFDFGGQSVFNVIHPFFLTKYGVYIVTFNMVRRNCLSIQCILAFHRHAYYFLIAGMAC